MGAARTHQRHALYLTALTFFLSGCIETTGSSENSSSVPSADFTVSADPVNAPPTTGGDNNTQPVQTPIDVEEEGFLINDGAAKTASSTLHLNLITLTRYQVKVSFNRSCTDGTWEAWSGTNKDVVSPVLNDLVNVSVQFKDMDGNVSHCYRQTIIHDAQGPDIQIPLYPAGTLEEGSTANLVAEINDRLGSVASVTCRMNGIEKPCFAGHNAVAISALPVAHYEFSITAVDDLGNASTRSVGWNVVSTTRSLTQNIRVDNYKKVDILFVIDNSGSMQYEQQSMGSRTRNFLSVLSGLDYQIAVTTTDSRSSVTWGDGKLLPIVGANNQYIIDTTTPIATAQDRLSKTLQRTETGDSVEQGIRSTYRLIERYIANEGKPRQFFRDGAQFAVVEISDEDESDTTLKNDPQGLINLVNSTFGGQKRFGFHSIITRPGDTACKSTYGYSYGLRLETMSKMTGGVIGSVCESDYAAQVTGIAQGVRDLLKTLSLQCQPLVDRGITIKRNGTVVSATYRIDGVNLKFDTELEPGDYTVDYSCLR